MRQDRTDAPAAPSRKLSLLFVSQFYHPEVAAVAQHLTDLAEYLAARGHDVSVYASFPTYLKVDGAALPAREWRNGVTVRRFRSTTFGRGTHLGRIADYASYYVQVLFAIVAGSRRDGVVFLTIPPLIAVIGVLARLLRGQRYAIWTMDLHPAAEFAAGMMRRRSIAGRLLEWLWRSSHRHADFSIALGQFMKARLVEAGIAPESVAVVSPWAAVEDFSASDREILAYRARLDLGNRFVVMYSGNAGLLHEFDVIGSAMHLLRDDGSIAFVFIGGGPRRPEIEAFARERQLPNVVFRDYEDRSVIGSSIAAGDAHLISLRQDFAGIAVPSKLYGIMAAARPAIFIGPVECEPADAILRAQCGEVVDPAAGAGSARLVEVIRRLQSRPDERRKLGENARRAFHAEYEMTKGCARIAAVIDEQWRAGAA